MTRRDWGRPLPTGECWCGCGTEVSARSFFVSGHDKTAESAVIEVEFGTVADFLLAHGYGPGGMNPIEERDRRRRAKGGAHG
jgi:hypothetical protein